MSQSLMKKQDFVRSGFTLVELLIATTITLLILLTMLRAFVVTSNEIKVGRNRIISAERVQKAADLIREDLSKLSVPLATKGAEVQEKGYFLYVDGPLRDQSTLLDVGLNSTVGDLDDVLMFTAVSKGRPFKGRFDNVIIESQAAEIIYWTELVRDENGNGFADYGDQVRLYRRVLLVRPDLSAEEISDAMQSSLAGEIAPIKKGDLAADYARNYYYNNDVSISSISITDGRAADSELKFPDVFANSLASLSRLENRTCHFSWDSNGVSSPRQPFPYVLYRSSSNPTKVASWTVLAKAGNNGSVVNAVPTFPALNQSPLGIDHNLARDSSDVPPVNHRVPVTLHDLQYAVSFVYDEQGNRLRPQAVPIEGFSVLENTLAFDVKVFDPDVPVYTSPFSQTSIKPDNPGYIQAINGAANFNFAGFGAFVDLGCFRFQENQIAATRVNDSVDIDRTSTIDSNGSFENRHPTFCYWGFREVEEFTSASSEFENKVENGILRPFMYRNPTFISGRRFSFSQIMGPTYTTYPGDYYESNLIDENINEILDEGTDGVPEVGLNGNPVGTGNANTYLDRDAIPPYDAPVRAIKIVIRTGSFNADSQVISATDQIIQRSVEISTRGK